MQTLFTVNTANGQRAEIALHECDIPFERQLVDLYSGEHRNEQMLALNPFGRMPVLQRDEGNDPIYGSYAIAMYAAETSGRLLPDKRNTEQFHHWVGIVMTDLAPALAGQFYLGTLAPEPDEWAVNWYADIVQRYLTGIDQHLAKHSYFIGDEYSLLDVLMYPTAATSVARMPGGLDRYPAMAEWCRSVSERPAVRRAMVASSV